MATYTLTRYSHGAALEKIELHRRDAVARWIKTAATEALRGMGKAEAIGGNYGEAARPDSYASQFWRDAMRAAALMESGDGGMMKGGVRAVDYGPHHTRVKAPYAPPAARLEIARDA